MSDKVTIKIPYISRGKSLNEDLTIEDLIKLSEPVVDRAVQPIYEALEKANLQKEDIDLVILAGGSSQLPGVAEKIYEVVGKNPRIIPKNLMLAISYGAALYQREVFNLPKERRSVRKLGASLGILISENGRRIPKLLLKHDEPLPAMTKQKYSIDEDQNEVTLELVTLHGNRDVIDRHLAKRTLKLAEDADEIIVEIRVTENRLIELIGYDPKHPDAKSVIQVDRTVMSNNDIQEKRRQLGIEIDDQEVRRGQQPCIGIDLGTTTSEFTYTNRNGEIALFSLKNPDAPPQYAEYCFPSVVYFGENESPDISNTVACNAMSNASEAERVFSNFKIENRYRPVGIVDGKAYSVCDLSTLLLNKIWKTAGEYFNDMNLESAVVTVPAGFDFDACRETVNAAKMAGISNVTLIDEPTAAFTYYSHVQDLDSSGIRYVLVFDFGGGTTDVAILDIKDSAGSDGNEYKEALYNVLAVGGAVGCGGKAVDDCLVGEIQRRFEEKSNAKIPPTGMGRLRAEVEKAKVQLSEYYNETGDN